MAKIDEDPSKEKTIEYLKNLRAEFLAEVANGKNAEELAETMSERVFKKSVVTMKGASLTI